MSIIFSELLALYNNISFRLHSEFVGSTILFHRFYVVFAIFDFQIESLRTCQRENNKEIDGVEKLDEYVAEQNSTKSGNTVPYHSTETVSKQQNNTSVSFSNVRVIQN